MELQVGDRLSDETGGWEVVGRPYTYPAAKSTHAHVQRVGPGWRVRGADVGSVRKVSVKRA